jgi:hypothetical protein
MNSASGKSRAGGSRFPSWIALPLVFVAAASVFWIGRNLTLDWTDEGHIIYPIWRVSRGALPYRDFRQLYGPSLFFLNGTLFWLFGVDLSVIRVSLVFWKAALVALVYLNARLVARPAFALAVCALGVAVWATPWWVFNTPYANHYGLLLDLAGIYGFLKLRRRFAVSCLWAGLCFGAAATFKQTSGIFAFLSLVLFLLWEQDESGTREAPAPVPWMVRLMRWSVLLGSAGLCIAYLARRNSAWNVLLLASPIALVLFFLAKRELGAVEARSPARALIGILCAGGGMAVPLAAYGGYYASQGLLGALLADTVVDLPRRIQWFHPLPFPAARPTGFALAIIAFLVAVRTAASRRDGRLSRAVAPLFLLVVLASLAAVLARLAVDVGLRAYVSRGLWHWDLARTLYPLPFVVVWVSLWVNVLRPGGAARREAGERPRDELVLLSFFSAASLLFLYPAGDFWHLLMGLPAFLPLSANLLEQYTLLPRSPRLGGRVLLGAVLGAVAVLCLPFIDTLRFSLSMRPGIRDAFQRATGITGWPPKFGAAADLIAYLSSRPRDEGLFVVCVEPMLYFLAARPSVLEADEFVFYLVAAGAIGRDDTRALVSEPRMIERLREAKPIVIDYAGSPLSARFRDRFAQTSRFLDSHFRRVASFSGYQVFSWAKR